MGIDPCSPSQKKILSKNESEQVLTYSKVFMFTQEFKNLYEITQEDKQKRWLKDREKKIV